MREHEAQIIKLAAALEVGDAVADKHVFDRRVFPPPNPFGRLIVGRAIAGLDKSVRDPGAAELILFTELTAGSRANDRHLGMMLNQMMDLSRVVPEAGNVTSRTAFCRSDDSGARGG